MDLLSSRVLISKDLLKFMPSAAQLFNQEWRGKVVEVLSHRESIIIWDIGSLQQLETKLLEQRWEEEEGVIIRTVDEVQNETIWLTHYPQRESNVRRVVVVAKQTPWVTCRLFEYLDDGPIVIQINTLFLPRTSIDRIPPLMARIVLEGERGGEMPRVGTQFKYKITKATVKSNIVNVLELGVELLPVQSWAEEVEEEEEEEVIEDRGRTEESQYFFIRLCGLRRGTLPSYIPNWLGVHGVEVIVMSRGWGGYIGEALVKLRSVQDLSASLRRNGHIWSDKKINICRATQLEFQLKKETERVLVEANCD